MGWRKLGQVLILAHINSINEIQLALITQSGYVYVMEEDSQALMNH